MANIHPTAIVHNGAELGNNVTVEPYAIIGSKVKIDEGTWIGSHVVIEGKTTIGKDNKIFYHASIGGAPQDLKYDGEETSLIIGDNNVIREFTTFNTGTAQGGGVTRVGSGGIYMTCSHIAHDCVVGDNIVMTNGAALAGHVTLEDHVIMGGYSAITQFLRIGKHAFVGAYTVVKSNFPPFSIGTGDAIQGINSIGLSRRGFSKDDIRAIKNAYKHIYIKKDLNLADAVWQLGESVENDHAKYFHNFIVECENKIVR